MIERDQSQSGSTRLRWEFTLIVGFALTMAIAYVIVQPQIREARWTERAKAGLRAISWADRNFASRNNDRAAPGVGYLIQDGYLNPDTLLIEPGTRNVDSLMIDNRPVSEWLQSTSEEIEVAGPERPRWQAAGDFMLEMPVYREGLQSRRVVGFSRPSPNRPETRVVLYSNGSAEVIENWTNWRRERNRVRAERGDEPLPDWP